MGFRLLAENHLLQVQLVLRPAVPMDFQLLAAVLELPELLTVPMEHFLLEPPAVLEPPELLAVPMEHFLLVQPAELERPAVLVQPAVKHLLEEDPSRHQVMNLCNK